MRLPELGKTAGKQIAMVQKRAGEELQGQIEVIEETEELTARAASNKDGKFDVGEAVVREQ